MFERMPFAEVNTISKVPPTMSVQTTVRLNQMTSVAKLTTSERFVKHVTVPDLTVVRARDFDSRQAQENTPMTRLQPTYSQVIPLSPMKNFASEMSK